MKKRLETVAAVVFAVLAFAVVFSAAPGSAVQAYADEETAQIGDAAKTGWFTENGKTVYYDTNSKKVTGAKKIDGKTYVFSKKGALVKNKAVYQVGKKYYRIDKKGVAERFKGVEAMAAKQVLSKKINGKLKKAFKWAAMDFATVAPCSSKKEAKIAAYYGKYAFKHGRGDCYAQAYAFYWMAKVLGYDVKVIRGYVRKTNGLASHAWCEIRDKKGKVYVYDPNFNKEYGAKLGNANAGYRIRYGAKKTLAYYSAKKKVMK